MLSDHQGHEIIVTAITRGSWHANRTSYKQIKKIKIKTRNK
jgi:hypothetical protein